MVHYRAFHRALKCIHSFSSGSFLNVIKIHPITKTVKCTKSSSNSSVKFLFPNSFTNEFKYILTHKPCKSF